jgi:uncharacterized membrane protein YfcA
MDSFPAVIPILAIGFLGAFTRSALGFGDALVAMPLLVMVVGVRTATPLVAFSASTIAATILVGSWRQVDIKAAWRLIVSALAGIPVGLLFLKAVPEVIASSILGVVLIGFGLYNLIGPRLPRLEREWPAFLFGFVGGVLGGAYNSNGPPAVIYGALRRWPPESFRATMQGYFLPTGLAILIGHGLAGLWTPEVLRLYAYSVPVILAAVYLGGLANRRLSGQHFNRLVYAFLVLMGVMLLV